VMSEHVMVHRLSGGMPIPKIQGVAVPKPLTNVETLEVAMWGWNRYTALRDRANRRTVGLPGRSARSPGGGSDQHGRTVVVV
jgi:hypothetical protein